MNQIKTAVIGVGYLGKFHAEKYANLPNANLVAVCDTNPEQGSEIAKKHNTIAIRDYQTLLGKVEAVSIAVPTPLHFQIAKFFLENKIHVLLEKPIARTIEEAQQLITIAKKNEVIFQIGHLERFNQVFLELQKILKNPLYIESTRIAPFKLRAINTNVVLDMMIHDIDIIQSIVPSPVKNIYANGAPILSDKADIASARIEFANYCTANVTASRVSWKTERKLRIFQACSYIAMDLHNKKMMVYRKGDGEMFPGIPNILQHEQSFEQGDALRDEIAAFLSCIETNNPPLVSGEDGKNALITATEIMKIVANQPAIKERKTITSAT